MTNQIMKFGLALLLLITVLGAGKASAQFVAPTYNLHNMLGCKITVFMEFSKCPTGGVYYTSATYTVPPFTTLSIPVNVGEDAYVLVTVPFAIPSPLSPVCAAGHPCIGAPTITSGTNGCNIPGNDFNVITTPNDLFVKH